MATQLTIIGPKKSEDEDLSNSGLGRPDSELDQNSDSSDNSSSVKRTGAETDWVAITPDGHQIVIPWQVVQRVLHLRAGQQVLAEIDSGEAISVWIG